MAKIYKYCSLERAKDILKNNEVFLNTPNNFNDPYDTNLLFDEKDIERTNDILINYLIGEEFKKLLFNKDLKVKLWLRPCLFLARQSIKLSEVTNKRSKEYRPAFNYVKLIRKFNSLGLKNGPKESDSQVALEKTLNLLESNEVKRYFKDEIKLAAQKLLITCFSKDPASMLMWSHYADNSKGVCLEFENEDFLDVIYTDKREKLFTEKIIYKILWHYHNNIDVKDDDLGNENIFIHSVAPFLIKSKVWEYEQEVRAIFNSANKNLIKRDSNYFYKMKKLKSITFGYRVDENEIRNVAKDINVELYKMELSATNFELIRKKVDN